MSRGGVNGFLIQMVQYYSIMQSIEVTNDLAVNKQGEEVYNETPDKPEFSNNLMSYKDINIYICKDEQIKLKTNREAR